VVKATVFVTDLGGFAKLNAIYAERFSPQAGALDGAGRGAAARRQRRDRACRPPATDGLKGAGRRWRLCWLVLRRHEHQAPGPPQRRDVRLEQDQ
jgi:hypothetical protein